MRTINITLLKGDYSGYFLEFNVSYFSGCCSLRFPPKLACTGHAHVVDETLL